MDQNDECNEVNPSNFHAFLLSNKAPGLLMQEVVVSHGKRAKKKGGQLAAL